MSETRQKATEKLTQIQSQLYALSLQMKVLEEEAKTLAGYLRLAAQEDRELQESEQTK